MHLCDLKLKVAARGSPLSQIQIEEIYQELKQFHPHIIFDIQLFQTIGDRDQKTSLRNIPKNDFFTKEIDEAILSGDCDIGIHSAKDLPSPLPSKILIAAVTKGIDSKDSLVMRNNDTLMTLPKNSKIATSSQRRVEIINMIRKDLICVDIRGNVGERLEKLYRHEIDGLVVAEAALIRLKLTHLNREFLPGDTAEGQGKLAITIREDNQFLLELFKCIDARR